MLQLAQKTDGVIVTNDNLRDLLDESQVWREIIKNRLLKQLKWHFWLSFSEYKHILEQQTPMKGAIQIKPIIMSSLPSF